MITHPVEFDTSFAYLPMTGTGFIKCMPTTDAGRLVAAARRVMEMELVLLANTAFSGVTCQAVEKHCSGRRQPTAF